LLLALALSLVATSNLPAQVSDEVDAARATVIVVVGAAGEEDYGKAFAGWAGQWEKAVQEAGARWLVIGMAPEGEALDRDRLKQALHDEPKATSAELWLVLLGHGTFDGKEARFNLRGPDVAATDLRQWLEPFRRPVVVINCASASSPWMNTLAAQGRVVVTATRSGFEQNFARFGQYLAGAIADPAADLDKDGQTSLLEAFLSASKQVGEFYAGEGRLATEHALLDDNGDGLGTPAAWFRGVRAVKKPADKASPDGARAHQFHLVRGAQERQLSAASRQRRDELELAIGALREQKANLAPDDYYARLEKLLVELARLYEEKPARRQP
jgi:hypothetical protein